MNTVLFMMDSALSHVNASLSFAKMLAQSGVPIIYTNAKHLEPYLTSFGFSFYEFSGMTFGIGFEKYWHKFNKSPDSYLDNLIDRLSSRIYHDRKKKLETLIEEVKPDVIFLDSFLSTDFIILYPYLKEKNIKLVFLQTMLSTLCSEGTPPLNADLLPENQKLVKKAWKHLLWQRKVQRFKDKIKYFGKDDLSMVKQKFKENKIPQIHKIVTNTSFRISFAGIPEWILAPAELEFFPERKMDWQTYLGSRIDLNRQEFADEKYANFEAKIQVFKTSGKKIIYCSFGTLYESWEGEVILFLKKLIELAKQNIHYQIIISLNEKLRTEIGEIPENVNLFIQVPQLHLLSNTDLFVTHGGLNSIKEALYFQVPMLIYPLNLDYDQVGNAARIFHHRLGLRGEIDRDSPQLIAEKIQTLLTNPIYKQNLHAFKEKTEAKYTEERVVKLIEELVREPVLI